MKVLVFLALLGCALGASLPQLPRPRLNGRIVGGSDASEGELPYQVSLRWWGSHICGGSVVSDKWVVTAAHCVQGSSAADFTVMVGSTNIYGGDTYDVEYVNDHPNYDSMTIDWDIAVLRIKGNIKMSDLVQAIGLPNEGEDPSAGSNAIVSGWGDTLEGGSSPENLQKVTVPIVDRASCNDAYGGITERMICAGLEEGGKDSCQGDSGGPLAINGVLQGVVSWGRGCAEPGYPGVYSRVASMRAFLQEETGL